MTFAAFAPAKINLYLHVGPPRADGLHPLESLVAFADVGDEIAVEPAADLSLALDGPFAAGLRDDPTENLALRAARALRDAAGLTLGACITLTKRLPIAAGVGGGSSDAAATLRALAVLWRLNLPDNAVFEIAARLGADVPVCLAARPALMAGVGERVSPQTVPPMAALLVNPGAPAPTGAVYRAFDDLRLGAHFAPVAPRDWTLDPMSALAGFRNDLEPAAIRVAPAIAEVLAALRSTAGVRLARLSGSGATCFALFDSLQAAQAAANALAAARRDWWIAPCRLGAVDVAPTQR